MRLLCIPVFAFIAALFPASQAEARQSDEPPADAPCWEGAGSTPSGYCVPRFVSLKFDSANGRAGPSRRHRIAWLYQRAGLPMQVVAETENWRRVRDPEGELVWMRRTLLSGRRTVYAAEETPLHARADEDAAVEAVAEAGAVMVLERCREGWCRLEGQGRRGWARTETLWGVYAHERSSAPTATAAAPGGDGSDVLSAPAPRDTALR